MRLAPDPGPPPPILFRQLYAAGVDCNDVARQELFSLADAVTCALAGQQTPNAEHGGMLRADKVVTF